MRIGMLAEVSSEDLFNLVNWSPLYLGKFRTMDIGFAARIWDSFLRLQGKRRDNASAEGSCERLIRTAHF